MMKPNFRVCSVVATVVAVLACTAAPRRAGRETWPRIETLPDGSKVICELERPTGSHIAEPVCRKLDDLQRHRERVRDELARPRSAITPPDQP